MNKPVAAAIIGRLLDEAGVSCDWHRHEPVVTIEQAREAVPQLTVDLVKTVVFEIAGTPQRLLVGIDAGARVDYRAVAARAACSRRALRLMPPDRVAAELGFEIGGVGPFPVTPDTRVLLDDALGDRQRVKVGGGLCTLTLELDFGDLVRVSSAELAPVSR